MKKAALITIFLSVFSIIHANQITFYNKGPEKRYYNISCEKGFGTKSKALPIAKGSAATYTYKCPKKTKCIYASWTQGSNEAVWYGPFKLPIHTSDIIVRNLDYDYYVKKCLKSKWIKNCNLIDRRS